MAPRANWKGFLRIAEVSCPVALHTAASTSDRIAFHTINRATGNRVRHVFVDAETGRPVERDDQVRGWEGGRGEYVVLEPDELAAVVPESDKTMRVSAFIGCREIDDVYFDKPYYLTPADAPAEEAFVLIREGMRTEKVAAIARAVLFRRPRTLLIRAHGRGLIATTLNFDYEVRSAADAFSEIPPKKIQGEMLDLARHIIAKKMGSFHAHLFEDRYEQALADLVAAKLEGRKIEPRREPARENVVDLMSALRASAGGGGEAPPTAAAAEKGASDEGAGGSAAKRRKSAKMKTTTAEKPAARRKAG